MNDKVGSFLGKAFRTHIAKLADPSVDDERALIRAGTQISGEETLVFT